MGGGGDCGNAWAPARGPGREGLSFLSFPVLSQFLVWGTLFFILSHYTQPQRHVCGAGTCWVPPGWGARWVPTFWVPTLVLPSPQTTRGSWRLGLRGHHHEATSCPAASGVGVRLSSTG